MNTPSRAHRVLMVDDEPHVLAGYRRTAGRSFDLTCAVGGAQGLAALAEGPPFAVVVTDMRMPEMTGLQFVAAARERSRESVFMMLTGNADQQTAVDAINTGHVFRFLNKPCAPAALEAAILAGVRQHELVTAERVLLRDTFTGTVRLLADALALSNPQLFAFQTSVKLACFEVLEALGVPLDWHFTVAGSICLVGLVALPGLGAGELLGDETLALAAATGSRLLAHVPRLASVSQMIARCREPAPLPEPLTPVARDAVELVGSQVLRLCIDLAREEKRRGGRAAALDALAAAGRHDARLLAAAAAAANLPAPMWQVREVPTSGMTAGAVVDADVLKADGTLLISGGQTLSELGAAALRQYARLNAVPPTLRVRVDLPRPGAEPRAPSPATAA